MSYGSDSNNHSSSSYRIKFQKEEFLKLLEIANPKVVYQVNKFFYFSFDGFVMYTEHIDEFELSRYKVIRGIEFSNYPWTKR